MSGGDQRPAPTDDADASPEQHRESAVRALSNAKRNPILSAEQSSAVALVHALLAIEQRISQLAANIESALWMLDGSDRGEAAALSRSSLTL
jgi:hypothetical protein